MAVAAYSSVVGKSGWIETCMRIGFLFNHYAAHQVPHAAPFAFELSRIRPGLEVIIACSTAKETAMAEAIGGLYLGHRCRSQRLSLGPVQWLIDKVKSRWKLKLKCFVREQNLDFFHSLDALVTPERNVLKLRSRFDRNDLKIIHTRHGVAGRDEPHYRHLELGQLVDDVPAGLKPALENAFSRHANFRQKQEEAIAYTFHQEEGGTSAERGARALSQFFQSATIESERVVDGQVAAAG